MKDLVKEGGLRDIQKDATGGESCDEEGVTAL